MKIYFQNIVTGWVHAIGLNVAKIFKLALISRNHLRRVLFESK